jgi:hypothetical protein
VVSRAGRLWLTGPTRLAGLARTPARVLLAIGAVVLPALAATAAGRGAAEGWDTGGLVDPLYRAVLPALHQGGNFYDAMRDLLRGDATLGDPYAALPTLAVLEAALPAWGLPLLAALLLALLLWRGARVLLPLSRGASATAVVGALLIAGAADGVMLWGAAPPAGWAAMLVALAILLRGGGRWIEPAAFGCAAALLDPAAMVALLVLGAVALLEGARREAIGWGAAALVVAGTWALHLRAVMALGLMPHAAAHGGAREAIEALVAATLPGIPPAIAAPAMALAVFGWSALPGALATRVVALLVAALGVQAASGLPSATLPVVLLPVGLAFAPDAIGDALRRAIDRRRITVTRISR